jgi:hypothetical protein
MGFSWRVVDELVLLQLGRAGETSFDVASQAGQHVIVSRAMGGRAYALPIALVDSAPCRRLSSAFCFVGLPSFLVGNSRTD